MQLHFRHEQEDWQAEVSREGEHLRVRLGEHEALLPAAPSREGAWPLDTRTGRRWLWVAVRGDERLVFCEGQVFQLRLPDPEQADEPEAESGGPLLRARMPGKVISVLVAVGDEVAIGQPLLIMESMKMETELAASTAGVVSEIMVTVDQVVAQDDPLVAVEPAAD